MAPIRVLQVMPAMDAGGMETFVMNVYRTIDRDKVQFDFLYHYDKPCFFDDEICTLGGNIYKMTVRQDNNLPRYLRELRALFAAHPEWRIIHGHYSGFGMFYNPVGICDGKSPKSCTKFLGAFHKENRTLIAKRKHKGRRENSLRPLWKEDHLPF